MITKEDICVKLARIEWEVEYIVEMQNKLTKEELGKRTSGLGLRAQELRKLLSEPRKRRTKAELAKAAAEQETSTNEEEKDSRQIDIEEAISSDGKPNA